VTAEPHGLPDAEPRAGTILSDALWRTNPLFAQVLGICSALAVTGRLATSLVMGVAVIFVAAGSGFVVSCLRRTTPRRVRMIIEVTVIATFVIVVESVLKAYWWNMSKALGPYVGLIVTNCILMGRAEAFAMRRRPLASALDGAANGLAYALVLAALGAARELAATGAIMGYAVLPECYAPNQLAALPPGAFFAMGLLAWLIGSIRKDEGGAR